VTAANLVTCADDVERPAADCTEWNGEWYPLSECEEIDDMFVPRDLCRQDYNGDWHLLEDVVQLANGEYAQIDDEQICHCRDGLYRFVDDCTLVDDEWYPDSAVEICEHCNDPVLRRYWYHSPGGGYMCEECYNDEVVVCTECETEMYHSDAESNDDGEYYCQDCAGHGRLVVGYSDKTANRLRPESKDKLLFGVELEVESKTCQDTGARWVRDRMPNEYCVLKNDCSLGSSGFEIVTRPDSMAVHRRMFAAILDDNPGRRLRSWIGGKCGMHVHVTKSALSQLQLAKMMCFLNDPANTAFVSTVAGRLPCSWCKVYPKKLSDVHSNPDRYVALNITSRTAEFRIFRGTLLASSFLKNLEFVDALVAYCAPAQRSIADSLCHAKFCRWLDKKTYPHLHSYLAGKGYACFLIRKAS
jgi:hypothetical protein